MAEGEMIVGNYELKNCVASGSTTQIWEVTQPGSPMQLAMKLMLDEHRKDATERAVLKHEFKIGKLMEHPSFLRFHEIEINRDHSFLIMDYFRSPSLKTHITANLPAIQTTFPKLSESLAMAFQYMHDTGWLHRDIKPDNILVNRAGEARVIDFNLSSKVLAGFGKLIAGKQKKIQGTRTYIAPETILKKAPSVQTDMYSLGVTLFETLTGQPLFAGDSPNALLKKHLGEDPVPPSAINPNVTKELDKVILRTLEKKPEKRFDSMQDLATALRGVKCFEEDPVELFERQAKEASDLEKESVDLRLDSRADADRTTRGITSPKRKAAKKKVDPKLLREEEKRKAAAEQQPLADPMHGAMPGMVQPGMMPGMMQPGMMPPGMVQPGMMPPGMMQPGMMPQMPGQPMPGQPMPGQPMPGQPMPHQPMPGQPMPGQPIPGQQMPGQPVPGQQMPAQPAAGQPMPTQPVPGQVMPGQPVPGQPTDGQPPPAAPPQAAPPPQQPAQATEQPPAQPPAEEKTDAAEPKVASTEDMIDLMSELDIE